MTVRGLTRLEEGARFDTLIVDGRLCALGCRGGRALCRSDDIHCLGDMEIRQIVGHGDLSVQGDLTCGELEFTGRIQVSGRIVCRGGFHHTGSLECVCLRAGGSMDLCESSMAVTSMEAPRISIQGLEASLLRRLGMEHDRPDRYVESIRCTALEADGLRCRSIEADQADLTGACQVGLMTYRTELRYRRGCEIESIRKADGHEQWRRRTA